MPSMELGLDIPSPSAALMVGFKACNEASWDDFHVGILFRQLLVTVKERQTMVNGRLRIGITSQDQETAK